MHATIETRKWKRAAPALACAVFALVCACSPREAAAGQASGDRAPAEAAAIAAPAEILSPDGRLLMRLTEEDGVVRYAVEYDGAPVIAPSRLGFRFVTGPNLENGLSLVSVERGSHEGEWETVYGERRVVTDHYNEIEAVFEADGQPGTRLTLRARLFDTGLGFRYEVERDSPGGQTLIADELTEFTFASDGTAWWIPSGEFNRYEYIFHTTPITEVWKAHTPFTARLEDGPYVSIHEAALVDYSGMSVDQERPLVFQASLSPASDGVRVRTGERFVTPWRTIQVSDSAVGLVNGSDLILNLNEPNVLEDTSWIEPGKYVGIWWGMHLGQWTWGSGPDHGATTERTRAYIDFAAENGFAGVLVEGWNLGWDGDWFNNGEIIDFTTPYPDFDLEGLAAYAQERGVRLIGHHEPSGAVTNYETQMEAAFDLYEANGVRAIKTGYVADAGEILRRDADGIARYEWHDGQFTVNHHQRVIERAAEHRLSINTHEPVKDTGLRRTWPNWMTREGARGQEFNAWGAPPNPPEHVAILPFTRLLAGPMDYTPGIFDLTFERQDGVRGIQHTLAKELALYVVIYSPLQMAADLIENYEAHPDMFQFIRDVPADWENSIALQGEVADYIVMARQERGGADWYLGALTDETPRSIEVALDFLEAGRTYTAEIYRDGPDAHWDSAPYDYVVESREVTAADTLAFDLAASGGVAVRFAAQ